MAEDVVEARRAGRVRVPGEEGADVRFRFGALAFLEQGQRAGLESLGERDVPYLCPGAKLGGARSAAVDAGSGKLRLDVCQRYEGVGIARVHGESALEQLLGGEEPARGVLRHLFARAARPRSVGSARTRDDVFHLVEHRDPMRVEDVRACRQHDGGKALQYCRSPLSSASPGGTHVFLVRTIGGLRSNPPAALVHLWTDGGSREISNVFPFAPAE